MRTQFLSLMVFCTFYFAFGDDTCNGIQNGKAFYPEGVCLQQFIDGDGSGTTSHIIKCDGSGHMGHFHYASSDCSGDPIMTFGSWWNPASWNWKTWFEYVCSPACKAAIPAEISSTDECVAADAEVVAVCEAVGLGPEDPAADACAAAMATVMEVSCVAAIKAGTQFTKTACTDACKYDISHSRRRLSSDVCGSDDSGAPDDICEHECNADSCGYIKRTTYWKTDGVFGESCSAEVSDAYFVESAIATNKCEYGVQYGCNETHSMTYKFSNVDCSGIGQIESIRTNGLSCDGTIASKHECFESATTESVGVVGPSWKVSKPGKSWFIPRDDGIQMEDPSGKVSEPRKRWVIPQDDGIENDDYVIEIDLSASNMLMFAAMICIVVTVITVVILCRKSGYKDVVYRKVVVHSDSDLEAERLK